MTKAAMRNKVHQYIDEADVKLVEVIYQLLEVYRKSKTESISDIQKQEILKRTASYKTGKTKAYSVAEARKIIKKKISN
jgi:competence protein ComGC